MSTVDKPVGEASAARRASRPRPTWRSPLATLWAVAAPMTLEMAVLRLLQLADLFWVGRLGSAAVAAAGIGMSYRWAFVSLALGLAVGGLVVVSRSAGEQDAELANAAAWRAIPLALGVTAVVSIAGLALAEPLLGLVRPAPEVWPLGLTYLRLTFLGLLPLAFLLTVNTLWRGTGATSSACAALGLAAGVSALLQPLLIFGLGLGIAGSPLALALGSVAGAALQIYLLRRGDGGLRLGAGAPALAPRVTWRVLKVGAPSSLQLLLRALARVALIGVVGRFGAEAVAAYTVAQAILMVMLIPSYGLANAAATLVPRKLQAGLPGWAMRRARAMGFANLAYVLAVTVALFELGSRATGLFCAAPQAQALGGEALTIMGLGYICSSLGVVLARGLDATGNIVPAAATNVVVLWGIQVPTAAFLGQMVGPTGVWLGLAVGSVANGMLLSYRFRGSRWRRAA